jgi:hypothetical protein
VRCGKASFTVRKKQMRENALPGSASSLNGSGVSPGQSGNCPNETKAHHRKDQGRGGDRHKRACRMKFRRKTSCSALRRCCPQTTDRLGLLVAQLGPKWIGRSCLLCPGNSDINLFRYGKGIIDLDAEVPDGAFDLGVPEQELHGAQIAGTPVDQGCLGPS